ncbi:hypothetical protein SAMN05660226_03951 [Parapedobacter luteus]|uniref:Uncharacterized protein n=1 Tax=Parapedobacter luteus TaxID=623280 RepID=A0A1T5FEU9_9SPHI|nr:hypothetical protein SAMN05660226_03951 [Parapedobacter luteus]
MSYYFAFCKILIYIWHILIDITLGYVDVLNLLIINYVAYVKKLLENHPYCS